MISLWIVKSISSNGGLLLDSYLGLPLTPLFYNTQDAYCGLGVTPSSDHSLWHDIFQMSVWDLLARTETKSYESTLKRREMEGRNTVCICSQYAETFSSVYYHKCPWRYFLWHSYAFCKLTDCLFTYWGAQNLCIRSTWQIHLCIRFHGSVEYFDPSRRI